MGRKKFELMKQKLIEYAISAVVIGAIIYLFAAFMAWEFNPGKWPQSAREIVGIWFLAATGIYTLCKEQPK